MQIENKKANGLKVLILLLVLLSFNFTSKALAEATYSIEPIEPATQVSGSKEKSYFDIKLKPRQEETLVVKVYNPTDQPISVVAKLSSAVTKDGGGIDYYYESKPRDSSLKYYLPDLIQKPDSIEISAQSEAEYQFKVTMPRDLFGGVIAGGIIFSQVDQNQTEQETDNNNDSQFSLKSKMEFTVPILIHGTKTKISGGFNLLDFNFDAKKQILNFKLQNAGARLILAATIETKIYQQGKKKAVVELFEAEKIKIAPNSNFMEQEQLTNDQYLRSGKYRVVQEITDNTSGDSWQVEKTFVVPQTAKKKVIKKGNKKVKPQQKQSQQKDQTNNNKILILAIVTVSIVVAGGAGIIYWRKVRK